MLMSELCSYWDDDNSIDFHCLPRKDCLAPQIATLRYGSLQKQQHFTQATTVLDTTVTRLSLRWSERRYCYVSKLRFAAFNCGTGSEARRSSFGLSSLQSLYCWQQEYLLI